MIYHIIHIIIQPSEKLLHFRMKGGLWILSHITYTERKTERLGNFQYERKESLEQA